ncbi:hypothetical protein HHI36_021512 [Cryptolaemus montrouzieri]|uniref:Cytochrome b561 domain-containing protein n=1 Tax=Cryptolaemus montrouzieri TaxID=559131 RepID=A0ABD2MX46_9CUCU
MDMFERFREKFSSSEFVPFLNANMEAQAEHERIKRYNTLYTISTILGIVLIILLFYWLNDSLGFSWSGTYLTWHPMLMVTGMIFLNSQSILVYRTGRNTPKFKLKLIHAVIHIVILVLVVLALRPVFNLSGLYSLHSWLGSLTIIIFCCQLLVGFTSFLYPSVGKNLKDCILPYHIVIGYSGFIMALVTAITGLTGLSSGSTSALPNFIGVILAIFGVLTIHLVTNNDYKREEGSEEDITLSE